MLFVYGLVAGAAVTMLVIIIRNLDVRTYKPAWLIGTALVLLLAGIGFNLWEHLNPPPACPHVVYLHGTGTVTIPGCRTVTRWGR